MHDLARFQRDFATTLEGPACAAMDPALAVYRNTSALGAIEALAANYPTVRMILGDRPFEQTAYAFVQDMPPRSAILATYGRRFPDFLESRDIALELPYLPDVARIDRLHLEALFAADGPPLDPSTLGDTAPEYWTRLKLKLHPATRFGWFTSPAMAIWLAHADLDEREEIVAEWSAGGALFVRPFGRVEAHRIDRAAHRMLCGILVGETVGNSAISTLNLYPDADVGAIFVSLAAAGLFAQHSL